jgi:hypothetical protein
MEEEGGKWSEMGLDNSGGLGGSCWGYEVGLGAATRKVGEVAISVVVRRLRGELPADSGDAQRRAILENGLESLQPFSSLSYSEYPETFTTHRYSPGIPFLVVVIDLVSNWIAGPRIHRAPRQIFLVWSIDDVW